MEYPSGDWEIVNYPPSSLDEDVEITEKSGVSSSRLEWVVNTGLSLGKQAVIAGFVMTSVPVMLPPLAVVSALGIASSLPFGLMFASYACTESLLSKLLPRSPPIGGMDYDDYVGLDEDEMNGAYEIPIDDGELTEKSRVGADEIPQREEEEFLGTGKNAGVRHDDRIDDVKGGDEAREVSVGNGEEDKDKGIAAEEPEKEQRQQQKSVSKAKSNSSKKKKKTSKKLGLSEKEAAVKSEVADSSSQEVMKTPENQRKEVGLPEKKSPPKNRERVAEQQKEKATSEDRDEMWSEVDAIRVILGVKTPRNASICDELRELYLFTGVEPPTDFSDFRNNLAFLNPVIGLE